MSRQFIIFAHCASTGAKRNFLIDSVDGEVAKCLFMIDYPAWSVERCYPAGCFSPEGGHAGVLSVWQNKEGKTGILCQKHGDDLDARPQIEESETV